MIENMPAAKLDACYQKRTVINGVTKIVFYTNLLINAVSPCV